VSAVAEQRGARLRLASLNIRYDNPADGPHAWPERREAVREIIDSLGCDIVGLQEVLPAQRAYLERRLRMRWYGVGREDGRQRGEQSPLLVDPARVAVRQWRTVWLSRTPEVPGSKGVDARAPRVATVLLAQIDGHPIGVINTHFDHRGARARAAAARQLVQLTAGRDRAWVVCGDLNVEPDDEVVQTLLAGGLRSVLPLDAGGTFHAFGRRRVAGHIDYVLISPQWQVRQAWIDRTRPGGVIPSDHWPVAAELELAAG